ncbi:hypothetical protein [Chelativorans sp. YIM 93263]|uniref:hypothetical protein n=1 Tax=Chelativorans sp. YIM 93263 TaxID=2906648 RepID=UPI002378135B|nr:hypothetical protein [Chelativorans sp. YIM 93263]
MLMKLDTSWLILAMAAVAMLSYFFAFGLDALLKGAGFGPVGNAIIILVGFFGAIYGVNHYGWRFSTLLDAVLTGVAGAFLLFLLLVLMKAILNRIT